MVSQLRLQNRSSSGDLLLWDLDLFDLDPSRMRNFLCGEALEVLDCVVGGVEEKFADEGKAFIIGDVGGWFEVAGFAVEVLGKLVIIQRCEV